MFYFLWNYDSLDKKTEDDLITKIIMFHNTENDLFYSEKQIKLIIEAV